MHAVVVRVSVGDDREQAEKHLRDNVVPQVTQAPGFVAGYWLKSDQGPDGLSMVVFESEDAAKAAADRVPSLVPDTVTLESVEVREVVAHG